MKDFFRLYFAFLAVFCVTGLLSASVTPWHDPGPHHVHSGAAQGDPDPATWISSSADTGLATAFSLYGTLTSTDGTMKWSRANVMDGAAYSESMDPTTADPPWHFEYGINLQVDTMAKVAPHVVDNNTTYLTQSIGYAWVEVWADTQFVSYEESGPAEVRRQPEESDQVEGVVALSTGSSVYGLSMVLIYRAEGIVYMHTDRGENVIHARVKTAHGDPADPIGYVKKYGNGVQQGADVDLH